MLLRSFKIQASASVAALYSNSASSGRVPIIIENPHQTSNSDVHSSKLASRFAISQGEIVSPYARALSTLALQGRVRIIIISSKPANIQEFALDLLLAKISLTRFLIRTCFLIKPKRMLGAWHKARACEVRPSRLRP